ncbi:MAG: MurR/RpiR family transcriptional regulator [Bacilli bacterium]
MIVTIRRVEEDHIIADEMGQTFYIVHHEDYNQLFQKVVATLVLDEHQNEVHGVHSFLDGKDSVDFYGKLELLGRKLNVPIVKQEEPFMHHREVSMQSTTGHLISKIEQHYANLTAREKQIAEYIRTHTQQVAEMTISQLAKNVGVGEATITRFCKKCTFHSFQGLKSEAIQAMHAQSMRKIQTGPLASLKEDYVEMMEKTEALVNMETIQEVAQCLDSSRKVYLFGIGNSASFCGILKNKLARIGLFVEVCSDQCQMFMSAVLVNEQDVVVCVSVRGETEDVIEAATLAKTNGATIISITSQSQSRLAKLAHNKIFIAQSQSIYSKKFVLSTEFPFIYIGDILFKELLTLDKKYEEAFTKTLLITKYIPESKGETT